MNFETFNFIQDPYIDEYEKKRYIKKAFINSLMLLMEVLTKENIDMCPFNFTLYGLHKIIKIYEKKYGQINKNRIVHGLFIICDSVDIFIDDIRFNNFKMVTLTEAQEEFYENIDNIKKQKREEIEKLIKNGKTNEEIIDFICSFDFLINLASINNKNILEQQHNITYDKYGVPDL